MSHDHDHHHGPTPERALWVAIVLNGAFLVLEAVAGWWLDSLALLADAGHMVSDVGALTVALIAVRLRHRKPNDGYTFGLRRAPVLGGLINAVALVAIVVFICVEAMDRFAAPPTPDGVGVLVTGVAGLAVNLVSAWYLARSRDRSVNTRGAILHLLADALGSVAAIVSAVALLAWNAPLADPIASVVIAVLILVGSTPLLRDTVRILLQRAPSDLDVNELRTVLEAEPSVRSVNDLHLWELASGEPVLSAMLIVDEEGLLEANRLCDRLRATLRKRFEVGHATLECRRDEAPDCALTENTMAEHA
ncbi:MAG: cation diffusion facilitator family transporter [Sandaracinaceae bacterium]|nr:MAG: cation transporter [Sandaracinaceae bacterium]